MFESAAAALSANDFSVSISLQIESDAEKEFLFSAREKLDMRRSRQPAKLDMIAITRVDTTNRLVVLRAPDHNIILIRLIIKLRFGSPAIAREPEAIKKTELQIPAARGMFAPHMIPIVFPAKAVSPQMMCTKPTTAATFAEYASLNVIPGFSFIVFTFT